MSSEKTSSVMISEILCSSCENSITDARSSFKCRTCSSADDGDRTQDNPTCNSSHPIYCNICIMPHIRKKHTVLDYKNMELIVCDDHKLNCDKFCKTCEKLICLKCVEDHYKENHSIISVEEKASEIKKIIHEAISEKDKQYKPMAAKGSFPFSPANPPPPPPPQSHISASLHPHPSKC